MNMTDKEIIGKLNNVVEVIENLLPHSTDVLRSIITALESRAKQRTVEDPILLQLCNVFGWQGGTIHQALEEIKKLKRDKEKLISYLSNSVCDPETGFKRKDLRESCICCKAYELCEFLDEFDNNFIDTPKEDIDAKQSNDNARDN